MKGESRKAIVDYNMVIRLDPENALAFARRGLAWQALKSYAKSVADFDAAIQLDPKESLAFNGLAWLRATCPDRTFRDGKKAVEAAAKACELSAWKHADHLATLAAAHAEAGDFDSAVEWQARANALDPTSRGAHSWRSEAQALPGSQAVPRAGALTGANPSESVLQR